MNDRRRRCRCDESRKNNWNQSNILKLIFGVAQYLHTSCCYCSSCYYETNKDERDETRDDNEIYYFMIILIVNITYQQFHFNEVSDESNSSVNNPPIVNNNLYKKFLLHFIFINEMSLSHKLSLCCTIFIILIICYTYKILSNLYLLDF